MPNNEFLYKQRDRLVSHHGLSQSYAEVWLQRMLDWTNSTSPTLAPTPPPASFTHSSKFECLSDHEAPELLSEDERDEWINDYEPTYTV